MPPVDYDRHRGRRYPRLRCDRVEKLGVAFEVLAQKAAFGGFNLKTRCSTRLYAGERPHESFGGLAPRHAVAQYATRRHFIIENVLPGRERSRLMEADAAHDRRDRKHYRDVIVERCVEIAVTEVAVEMRMQFAQASEAFDNVGAHRTNEQPVHVE